MTFLSFIGDTYNSAVDINNYGFLSSIPNFELGLTKILGIVPNSVTTVASNQITSYSTALGTAGTNILAPLNPINNLSSPLIIGGGIIGLVIFGFVTYKVLKYI